MDVASLKLTRFLSYSQLNLPFFLPLSSFSFLFFFLFSFFFFLFSFFFFLFLFSFFFFLFSFFSTYPLMSEVQSTTFESLSLSKTSCAFSRKRTLALLLSFFILHWYEEQLQWPLRMVLDPYCALPNDSLNSKYHWQNKQLTNCPLSSPIFKFWF